MTRRFFSGNNLDQALMAAARHYGIEPAQLAYRQIEKRHGFLRTRKAVVISVDPDLPRRGPEVDGAAADPAVAEAPLVASPAAPPEPLGARPEPLAEPVAPPIEARHEPEWAEESEARESDQSEEPGWAEEERDAVPVGDAAGPAQDEGVDEAMDERSRGRSRGRGRGRRRG